MVMKLLEDEKVIKRQEKIGYKNVLQGSNNELVLTDKRLILIQKSVFGKEKDVLYFPLEDIRTAGGEPQIRMGKKDIRATLDVYFSDGFESFVFTWEDEVKEWIEDITDVMSGKEIRNREGDWMKETLQMAESFAGTIDKYKEVFGLKEKEQAAVKCPSCSASLAGFKGETATCPYCGTKITL